MRKQKDTKMEPFSLSEFYGKSKQVFSNDLSPARSAHSYTAQLTCTIFLEH